MFYFMVTVDVVYYLLKGLELLYLYPWYKSLGERLAEFFKWTLSFAGILSHDMAMDGASFCSHSTIIYILSLLIASRQTMRFKQFEHKHFLRTIQDVWLRKMLSDITIFYGDNISPEKEIYISQDLNTQARPLHNLRHILIQTEVLK